MKIIEASRKVQRYNQWEGMFSPKGSTLFPPFSKWARWGFFIPKTKENYQFLA
jgi:hypothetical protein